MRLMLSLVIVVSALVSATNVRSGQTFRTTQHAENDQHAPASLAEIIKFVQLHGWPIDLGHLCNRLSLMAANNECAFRQIAIHTKTDELDDHGFNVPNDEFPLLHVVIYRATPITGEFFLASQDGKLLKAIFRARGTDFQPMSEVDGSAAFAAELSFWKNNFDQIEHDALKPK